MSVSDNPEGSLTVWKCKRCGERSTYDKFSVPHRLRKCGEVEPIPYLPLSVVQERERAIEAVIREMEIFRQGVPVNGPTGKLLAAWIAALAYHRRESEDG